MVRLEGDQESLETWPRHNDDPANLPADAFRTDGSAVCFAATMGPGTLGCSTGAIPQGPAGWFGANVQAHPCRLAALAELTPPAIPPLSDGLYHGERLDLTKIDLGKYLGEAFKRQKSAARVVLHLAGTARST